MLVSTGLLLRSAMAAGLVADAPTETLRTGWLARERERARSTGNGLTYLARDTPASGYDGSDWPHHDPA
jgi:hypothetical protein